MKRIFLILIVCLVLPSMLQAQNATFAGVKVNQDKDTFVKALKEKGFTLIKSEKELKDDNGSITMKGKFWKFDDNVVHINYSLITEKVSSIHTTFEHFTSKHYLVQELMNSLDTKYGQRVKVKGTIEEETVYRWLSTGNSNMITISWVVWPEAKLDYFTISYYSDSETEKILKKERAEKNAELDGI